MVNISKIANVITPKYEALAKKAKPVGSEIDRAFEYGKTIDRDAFNKVIANQKTSALKKLINRFFG